MEPEDRPPGAPVFSGLLAVRRGHFLLESGLHGDVWFDLDEVFVNTRQVRHHLLCLAGLLAPYGISAVCGAMSGGAFVAFHIAVEMGVDFFYTERHAGTAESGRAAVSYLLPRGVRGLVPGRRVAVLDDVINAGSAAVGTCRELRAHGAQPVVMGCLLTVGGPDPKRFPGDLPPVVTTEHLESGLWQPSGCPLCVSRIPLIDPNTGAALPG
jgi:orotate phosphoribosyltransferase